MSAAVQSGGRGTAGAGTTKGQVVYPAAALVATGTGILSLGIVFYAAEVHGASPAQIGCLAATSSLCYVIGCALLRRLAERLRPQHNTVAAAAVMGLAVLLVLGCGHLLPVYLCYALYGLATALFWPPLMAWLSTGLEGQSLNRTMGWFNVSWSCGGIAGPIIAGALAKRDARLPVAAAGLLYLIAALYVAWSARRLQARTAAAPRLAPLADAATPGTAGDGLDHSTPLRYPAWVGLFAAYAVMGVVFNVFPLAAQDLLGLSKFAVGVVLFGRALTTSLALGALGRSTVWHFRAGLMAAELALFALVMAALPLAGSALTAGLVLGAVGILLAQCYANSLFHGVAGSRRRAARMAIHEALLSAGMVCGGACGGILFQTAGYAAVCRAAAVLLLLAAAVAAGFAWRGGAAARPGAGG